MLSVRLARWSRALFFSMFAALAGLPVCNIFARIGERVTGSDNKQRQI